MLRVFGGAGCADLRDAGCCDGVLAWLLWHVALGWVRSACDDCGSVGSTQQFSAWDVRTAILEALSSRVEMHVEGLGQAAMKDMKLTEFVIQISGAEWTVYKVGQALQISPHDAAAAIF